MNRKLNVNKFRNNTFLLPLDILELTNHFIGLKFCIATLNDMNHLKNIYFRSVGDLLQE
uniref:RNA polymerase Rpb2 domain-containing protein n=1 Tax=Solanum lycopersicum TaxID=4081 RepID=A0A3Q7HK28_SOLLC